MFNLNRDQPLEADD